MSADRWSDVLTFLAAVVGIGVLVMVWPRRRRVRLARRRHPSTPPVVSVTLDTDGFEPRWRVSTPSGAPHTSLDIFTWRPSETSMPWLSEPIVEPIELEPGASVLLESLVVDATVAHDVVLAWTLHRPEGDVQGSLTLVVEPEADQSATAHEADDERTPWWLLIGSGVIGAALVVIVLLAGGRLLDGDDDSARETPADDTTTITDPAVTDPSVTQTTVDDTATNTATTTATTSGVPATEPAIVSDSTEPTTATTERAAAATTSPTTETSTETTPASTAASTTISPTTTSIVTFTTEDDDGRTISLTATAGECRFGDDCLIAGFAQVGFANEGEYVCEFGDGTRFVFRYIGDGAENACATSGTSITIEIDGVRTQTVTRAALAAG